MYKFLLQPVGLCVNLVNKQHELIYSFTDSAYVKKLEAQLCLMLCIAVQEGC